MLFRSVALRHVGSSRTRARTCVPCAGRRILNHCATREAPGYLSFTKVTELFGVVARLKQESLALSILFNAGCPVLWASLKRSLPSVCYVLSSPLESNPNSMWHSKSYSLALHIIKIYS